VFSLIRAPKAVNAPRRRSLQRHRMAAETD
jgi:hypothetical protein